MNGSRLAKKLKSVLFVSIVAAVGCTPSQSGSPEPEAPIATSESEAQPEMGQSAEEASATEGKPGQPAEPGSLDLPPGNASAWNTGQSDGQPGKADRGIQDYQRIIQDNRERFRSCYDAALAKNESLRGRVTLVWVLDPKGAVRDGAHVDGAASDYQDEFLEKCMAAALKTLTFPPSKRGMDSTVRYPFEFYPRTKR